MRKKSIALYGNARMCAVVAPNAQRLYPGGKVVVIIEPESYNPRYTYLTINGIPIDNMEFFKSYKKYEFLKNYIKYKIDIIIPVVLVASSFQSSAEEEEVEKLIEAGLPAEKVKHDILFAGLKKYILCGDLRECEQQLHNVYARRDGVVIGIYNYYNRYSGIAYDDVGIWKEPAIFSRREFDEVILFPEKDDDKTQLVETLLSYGVPKEKINDCGV